MWDVISTFIRDQFEHNQLFSGGLVLMIAGGLFAYFREIPAHIWNWLRCQFIIEIDVLDNEQAFDWLELWLAEHSYSRDRARSLAVKTIPVDYAQRERSPGMDERPRILFTPAPGCHWLFYRGCFVSLYRERPSVKQQVAVQNQNARESFRITIFSRDRGVARQLLEDARDVALPKGESRLSIYRVSYCSWSEQMKRAPRNPDSVLLANGLMESLVEDVRQFLTRRDWYGERGVPYRRGYLLYGPPGTGKSSAVVAIASALKMDIAMLSLSNATLDDAELIELLANVPPNCIVLIEDIDCAFLQRRGTEEKGNRLSFSGLLNALDGVAAGEGRVLFATTNHLERLDPALVRPGRIDRKEEVGYATRDQIRQMFVRFYPGVDPAMAEYFAGEVPERLVTMSAVQTHLLRFAGDANQAVKNVADLTVVEPVVPAAEVSAEEELEWHL